MIAMTICHYDETNSSGGLDKQARLLSRTLAEAGQEVVVLASTRSLKNVGWSREGDVRVRLFWTYASPQISGRYLPAALIWAAQLLAWIILHRRQIDVIHGHQIRIHAFVGALAQKYLGIPAILKSATGGAGADIKAIGGRKYFGARGRRFIVTNTSKFVATTRSIADDLRQSGVGGQQIVLIPNGLTIAPTVHGLGRSERSRRCVYVGRLAADKNVLSLAKAAIASASASGLSLDFYGHGPLSEELRALLSAAAAPNVKYLGFITDPSAILGQYGWLLLPSNAEGLSNAMLEAMSAGVVPVATRVSGCVDHISPGKTGFFLDGTSEEALHAGFATIAAIEADKWNQMSGTASAYAREHFDIRNVAQDYGRLYRSLEKISRSDTHSIASDSI